MGLLMIHRACLAAALVCAVPLSASAATIAITGVPGAGEVSVTLSGSTTATGSCIGRAVVGNNTECTTRTIADAGGYADADTIEFIDLLQRPSLSVPDLDNTVVPVTSGALTLSVQSAVRAPQIAAVTAFFLDNEDDLSDPLGRASDDLGFRTASRVIYREGDTLSFFGTATLGIDIGYFVTPYSGTNAYDVKGWAGLGAVTLTAAELPAEVPLPAAILSLGGILGAWSLRAAFRRRAHAVSNAA